MGGVDISNPRRTVNMLLVAQLGFVFCYMISSFVAAGKASGATGFGFIVVWSGFLQLGYCLGAAHVLNRSSSTLAVGFVIGTGAVMTQVMLYMAVLGGASGGDGAFGALVAFGSLILICLFFFLVLLVKHKDDWCDGGMHNTFDNVGPPAGGDFGSQAAPAYGQQDANADNIGTKYEASGTADL